MEQLLKNYSPPPSYSERHEKQRQLMLAATNQFRNKNKPQRQLYRQQAAMGRTSSSPVVAPSQKEREKTTNTNTPVSCYD